jgi:hypothetical protein
VFERGNYLSPGKVVEAGTPAVLHPMRPEGPANRLGLARWLVDRENPLVARVVVNRWWAELFGRGIVSSVEDFGAQGELPTHPELLDWLAVDFMDNGWSTKRTLKQIVTSATYRQSVLPESQQVLERDPLNELLARSPRLRLPAEMVRDNALAIAGLLSDRIGGPPVYPPQPDGIWKFIGTFQPRYLMSTGEDRYRRGLYAVWRRSAPYASFTNFDAKDRSTCVVRRSRTNTPLQALTLLNDEAFVEMALGLAQRVLHERPQENADERLRYAFRLAVAREPSPQELGALRDLLDAQSRRIVKDKEAPEVLLAGVRSFTPAPDVDRNELAAWYFVANAILNLDETITRG